MHDEVPCRLALGALGGDYPLAADLGRIRIFGGRNITLGMKRVFHLPNPAGLDVISGQGAVLVGRFQMRGIVIPAERERPVLQPAAGGIEADVAVEESTLDPGALAG